MMIENVTTVSQVIQLAIAPVFLLMGVSALLGVLTGRLGRVVDRFRVLNEKCESPIAQAKTQAAPITVKSYICSQAEQNGCIGRLRCLH